MRPALVASHWPGTQQSHPMPAILDYIRLRMTFLNMADQWAAILVIVEQTKMSVSVVL